MRHTGYLMDNSKVTFCSWSYRHIYFNLSLSGIIVSRHATRDVNRGGENEASEKKEWADENEQNSRVGKTSKKCLFFHSILCTSLLLCLGLFTVCVHCVWVCVCVCACTARCGLSLSFEVQLFGEALCAARPKAMFGHKRNELMPSWSMEIPTKTLTSASTHTPMDAWKEGFAV